MVSVVKDVLGFGSFSSSKKKKTSSLNLRGRKRRTSPLDGVGATCKLEEEGEYYGWGGFGGSIFVWNLEHL